MRLHLYSLLAGAACAFGPSSSFAQLGVSYAGQISLPGGGEIVSYTAHEHTLATTYFTGNTSGGVQAVNLYNFSAGGAASLRASVDLSGVFGLGSTYSVTSVALDPQGRGFGVATIAPVANTTTVGKLAFFDYTSGFSGGSRLLHTVDVGYHPDSVRFSTDGSRLIVANEGEANIGVSATAGDGSNAPGSLSIINLSGIGSASQVSGIASPGVIDFSAGNLAGGASLSGVRNPYAAAVSSSAQIGNSASQTAFNTSVPDFTQPANISNDVEPEYAVIQGDKAYVSLQENNAIAVVDLSGPNANKITAIHNLGTINQTVDASDADGQNVPDDTVKGMPMPDTIAVVNIGGTDYLVTANEGDARVDDRDASRFGDTSGGDSMNALLDSNYPTGATGLRVNSELGRLNVSRIDGDTDGDGKIDEIRMLGTRSFSIWDAATGALVADSGNLEVRLLALDPTRHNINRDGTATDNRSDDKGPEPEALTIFTFDGKTYVAVGLERQNGVLVYDISNPLAPSLVDYVNGADNGLISPESLLFISASESPDGLAYLVGGFEGVDGSGASAGLGIYGVAAIPEPASAGVLAGVGALGLVALRRKRRAPLEG